jgi:hypothetical protein
MPDSSLNSSSPHLVVAAAESLSSYQQVVGKLISVMRRGVDNYQLPITNYQLPITNYQLPITNYQLPITNAQLPIFNICKYKKPTVLCSRLSAISVFPINDSARVQLYIIMLLTL